jgi:hypothetical protein
MEVPGKRDASSTLSRSTGLEAFASERFVLFPLARPATPVEPPNAKKASIAPMMHKANPSSARRLTKAEWVEDLFFMVRLVWMD